MEERLKIFLPMIEEKRGRNENEMSKDFPPDTPNTILPNEYKSHFPPLVLYFMVLWFSSLRFIFYFYKLIKALNRKKKNQTYIVLQMVEH